MMTDPVQKVMALNALFGAAIVGGAAALYGTPEVIFGAVAGVALALGNTFLVSRHVTRLFAGQMTGFSIALFVLKLAALAGVLYVLIVPLELNPLAVLAGFTTLAFAVTASAFGMLRAPAASGAE